MNIAELAYQLYKVDWMKRILSEIHMNLLKDYYTQRGDNFTKDEHISDMGYNGELCVDYEEFINTDYFNEEYIKYLFNNKKLFDDYQRDIWYKLYGEDE